MTRSNLKCLFKLQKSSVAYDEEAHTYHIGDRELSGITGIIKKMLFPDKYSGVPDDVLAQAKRRGKEIHEEIELFVNGGIPTYSDNGEAFKSLGIDALEAEYVVTDSERIATPIDLIDKELNLYDTKTTYVLDTEYVAWQLSICAWLFERQTGMKAGRLFALHIRDGAARKVEVNRIDESIVNDLISAYFEGREFSNPLVPKEDSELAELSKVEKAISLIKTEADFYEKRRKELVEGLKRKMEEGNVKSFETSSLVITYVAETTRTAIDSARLREEMPDVARKYEKESVVGSTVRIRLK